MKRRECACRGKWRKGEGEKDRRGQRGERYKGKRGEPTNVPVAVDVADIHLHDSKVYGCGESHRVRPIKLERVLEHLRACARLLPGVKEKQDEGRNQETPREMDGRRKEGMGAGEGGMPTSVFRVIRDDLWLLRHHAVCRDERMEFPAPSAGMG
jgi:hypothetical protein